MKILYLDDAVNDLVWFHQYYTTTFPDGASNAFIQFDAMEEILANNPFIGKTVEKGIKKLHIPNTPFSYIYRVEDEIQILRLWDERRNPKDIKY